jgi:SAM-dependent methyltransferase
MLDDLEVELAVPHARGARVLEVGAGTGLILRRLAAVAEDAVGVDLSLGMASKARQRGLGVLLATATELPFRDDTFDLVCCFKVLAHVPDVEGALREMARVTRPGGRVLAELYNPMSLRYLAKRLAGPQPIGSGLTEADVYTRWDSPSRVGELVPPSTRLVKLHGLRIVTPAAFVHRVPGVSRVLPELERLASRSPLRRFGGFLVAELRKEGG